MIKKICKFCKKDFISERNRKDFCSRMCFGKFHSIRMSKDGNPNYHKIFSEEHKRKIGLASAGRKPMLGKHHSPETKHKISLNKIGKHLSEEHIEKIRQRMVGTHLSQDTKNKISKAKSGKPTWIKGTHLSMHTKELIRKAHIGKKRADMVGEKNPAWNGGTSRYPYAFEWTSQLRKTIKERDKYNCQLCGKNQKDLKNQFIVHHIDYNKKNCNPNNLITLCKSCHGKTNHNRKNWMKSFKNFWVIK